MGNYYGDYSHMLNGILNGVVDDARRAGSWDSWTVTLPPVEIASNSIKSGSFATNAISATAVSSYTPAQIENAIKEMTRELEVKCQSEKEKRAFDPWHTEIRERYTLKPKMAAWGNIFAFIAAYAVFVIHDFRLHELSSRSLLLDVFAAFGSFVIGSTFIYAAGVSWRKFSRWIQ